jgi:hypothetical protein
LKGKWEPYRNVIGETQVYRAGRQLNTAEPLHSGNVEYKDGYSESRDAIVDLCKDLNEREGLT